MGVVALAGFLRSDTEVSAKEKKNEEEETL